VIYWGKEAGATVGRDRLDHALLTSPGSVPKSEPAAYQAAPSLAGMQGLTNELQFTGRNSLLHEYEVNFGGPTGPLGFPTSCEA